MTKSGAKLIEGMQEAVAVAKGEQPAARIHHNGFAYVPEDRWQAIETAPLDRTPVIIAVPNKERDGFIVGEAYFDPENYTGGDWWWAGTSYGDYHGGPISEINHWPPQFWQPLPTPPQALLRGRRWPGLAKRG